MRRQSLIALFASAAFAGLTGQVSFAQDKPQGDSAGLQEVVVTARKKEESLQDVPVAVTALTAENISERQINSIDDVAKFAPGLVFSKAFGRATERPVVRGLGSVLAGTAPGLESGTAYFIDNVYYPGDISSLDLGTLERVEVIRGPQSALYGRNTYAGAVNFITRDPSSELQSFLKGNIDKDETRASFRVEGGIGEFVTGELAVRYYNFDGQYTNNLTGKKVGQEKTKGVSGTLVIKPSDNVKIKLRASYNEDDDGSRPLFFKSGEDNNCYPGTRSLASFQSNITPSTNTNQYFCGTIQPQPVYLNDGPVTQPVVPVNGFPLTSAFTAAQAGIFGFTTTPFYADTRTGLPFSGVKRKLTFGTGLVEWNIAGSGYTLTVDGGAKTERRFTGSDSDHSSLNVVPIDTNGARDFSNGSSSDFVAFDDWSLEAKIASPADRRFRWLVGVYHFERDQDEFNVDFVSTQGQSAPNRLLDTYNKAIFGSLEFDFTDNISATVEARNSTETVFLTDRSTAGRRNLGSPGPVTFSQRREFKTTTPRVTLDWKITPDITTYAIFAKGSKPGGFNGAVALSNGFPQFVNFEPEEVKTYELGLKASWLNRRLTTNIALYKNDVTAQQLTTPIQNAASAALTSVVTNQGAGEVKGVEVEVQLKATDHLNLGLTYALADTEYTQGCDDFQYQLTSGGGALLTNAPSLSANYTGRGDCSIVGNPFPLVAKNTATLTADYERPVGDGDKTFYTNADLRFEDKKAVQVHANPWTGSATLLGLRMGYKTDRWQVGVYARNLLNEDSVVSATRWFGQFLFASGLTPSAQTGVVSASTTLDAGLPARFFFPAFTTNATTGAVTFTTPLTCPGSTASAPINMLVDPMTGLRINPVTACVPAAQYSLPRAFFGALRQQRQVGLEFSYKFNGEKAAPPVVKPADSDGDGVTDDIDRCPGTPAGTAVDASGCPLPKDSDGDGVIDPNDKCPNTPAGQKVDASGCELDDDGDGVINRLDQCPMTPAGAKVDANGCELDDDGDGVVNSKDQCADTPKGDRVDSYGCSFKTELKLPGVVFETNSADLKAESLPVLDGAVATLKRYPELIVEVAGHTDNVGSDAFNLDLSKRRAATVLKYLQDNGAANSLKSRGYGERQPVASNKTDEGRQQNRRVVLRILSK